MAVPQAPQETLTVQTDSNIDTHDVGTQAHEIGNQARDIYGGIRSFNNQLLKI